MPPRSGKWEGCLQSTGLLGVLEVTDIPNVHDREAVERGASLEALVTLVVHEEELLVHLVVDPALVSVVDYESNVLAHIKCKLWRKTGLTSEV